MNDNRDTVKIQLLIEEAERLPKDEAVVVLKAVRPSASRSSRPARRSLKSAICAFNSARRWMMSSSSIT